MEEQHSDDLCSHCHNKKYLKGFPNKLCEDCRQAFIQYPIPRWIWWFAAGIVFVMIISMIRLPKSISAAIDLSRAESAMEDKRYYTAQRELNHVLEVFPDNAHANALLLISSAYNWDLTTARDTYDKVANKTLDNDVLKQIDVALLNFDNIFAVDTNLIPRIESLKGNPDSLKHLFAEADSLRGPDFLFTGRFIAEKLFDLKQYQDAEIMLQEILNENPDYYPALSLMSATKRNTGDYDGALAVCDRLLAVNKEDIGIVAQKARIELKRRQLKAAQVYVDQAIAIDPEQTVTMEAQAMLYYFSNKKPEAMKVLQTIKSKEKGTGDTAISDRLEPILNGTVIY
jgi:tetratricopeptide (TPR) repeat protein